MEGVTFEPTDLFFSNGSGFFIVPREQGVPQQWRALQMSEVTFSTITSMAALSVLNVLSGLGHLRAHRNSHETGTGTRTVASDAYRRGIIVAVEFQSNSKIGGGLTYENRLSSVEQEVEGVFPFRRAPT